LTVPWVAHGVVEQLRTEHMVVSAWEPQDDIDNGVLVVKNVAISSTG